MNHKLLKNQLMKKIITLSFLVITLLAGVIHTDAKTTKKKSKSRTTQTSKKSRSSTNLNGHAAVDLGLSVKWASCNIGASCPEDIGDYFLGREYDIARNQWGGSWRMPTVNEIQQLINQCYWRWTGKGYVITGPNGNSIFLPTTGRKYRDPFSNSLYYSGEGFYWTGSLCGGRREAYTLIFENRKCGINAHELVNYAMPIRPVTN